MTTTGTDSRRLRLGTRGSRLALTQSGQVADALMATGGGGAATAAGKASEGSGGLSIDLVTVRTDGDGDRTPLRQLGGVGVFAAGCATRSWMARWTWWSTPSRTCPRSRSRG